MHPYYRYYGTLTFVLLFLTVAVGPATAGVLTKFDEARITIEAHQGLKTFGMTKDSLQGHVVSWLQMNLPRLAVKPSIPPFIHVRVLVQERSSFAYGYIGVRIVRKVTINDTDLAISGGVWQTGGIVLSQVSQTQDFVLQSLDQLLDKFATQWNRDNPLDK